MTSYLCALLARDKWLAESDEAVRCELLTMLDVKCQDHLLIELMGVDQALETVCQVDSSVELFESENLEKARV